MSTIHGDLLWCDGGWPGSCHEHELLALSGIAEVLDVTRAVALVDRGVRGLATTRQHGYASIGDRRTKDRLTDAERAHNRDQAGLRALVEQSIGQLAGAWSLCRWRGLLYRVRAVYRATAVLISLGTYLRLVQTAVEGLFYARAINRIHRHYVDLDPEASRWFVLCAFDDPAGALAAMGLATPGAAAPPHGHLWSYAATMVAVVTSSIGRVGVALAANAVGAGRLPVPASAALGVVVTVACGAGFGWHQLRRWQAAEASVPSLFPSQPGRAPALDQLAAEPSQADS